MATGVRGLEGLQETSTNNNASRGVIMFHDPEEQKWRERFGLNLWKIIDSKNLSIRAAAELAGIPPTTMFSWVNGERTPTAYKLISLSDVLCVSLDELIRV